MHMELSTMTNTAMASGNILAMRKALDSQETLTLGLLEGMEEANSQTVSSPPLGVNTATDGGLDIRI